MTTTTTRTRRGDLAIIKRTNVSHSTSGRTETTEYQVMVVCSITRDGRVTVNGRDVTADSTTTVSGRVRT